MTKLLPLAAAAVAVLALGACGTQQPQPERAVVTNVHPYTAGNGTVQAVYPAPRGSASAGSSSDPMQRLEIKMDNGTVQYVDTPNREFAKGTRISLSEDRIIKKM